MIRPLWTLIIFFICLTSQAAVKTVTAEKIVESYQLSKQQLLEQEQKQRRVLSALYQINAKVKRAVSERSSISQEKATLEESNTKLLGKITDLEKKTAEQRAMLASRLRAIYRLSGQSLARMLFSAQSSSSLDRNLRIMGSLASRDKSLATEYVQTKNEAVKKRNKLAGRLKKVESLNLKLLAKEENLRKEQQQKEKLLLGIKKSQLFTQNQLNQIKSQGFYSAEIGDSGILDNLFQASFSERKGSLSLPMNGKVLSSFGVHKDPTYQYSFTHKGIRFSSMGKEKIRSVFAGKIAFQGILPGLGKTLIVDHGDHYFTVYGQLSEPLVLLGKEVTENQVLGMSDQLYFEIRHFSEPYDPMLWMKGKTTL